MIPGSYPLRCCCQVVGDTIFNVLRIGEVETDDVCGHLHMQTACVHAYVVMFAYMLPHPVSTSMLIRTDLALA